MSTEESTPVLPSSSSDVVVAPPVDAGGEPEPLIIRMPVSVTNVELTVLAVLAVLLVLQYAQTLLIPIVIGILISYVLAPMVTALYRMRIPRSVGAAVAVLVLVGSIALGAYTLSDQAMAIVTSVPQAAQR